MDRGAWKAVVHGVAKSRTRLSDFTSLHFTLQLYLQQLFMPESQYRTDFGFPILWFPLGLGTEFLVIIMIVLSSI